MNYAITLGPNTLSQDTLFHSFTPYITASCRDKMYRRINNWASDGFIFFLCRVKNESIQNVFVQENLLPSKRRDNALGEMLQEPTLLKRASKEYRAPENSQPGPPPTFGRLACKFKLAEGEGDRICTIYSEDICVEFHQLLVATLLGYKRTLAAFTAAMGKMEYTDEIRENLAIEFHRFSRLLWRIACSQMLSQHLRMLGASGLLPLPVESDKCVYQRYMNKNSLPLCSVDPLGDEGDEGDNSPFMEMDVGPPGPSDQPTFNEAHTFLQWIKLLVSHWVSADIISVFCAHRGPATIEISLASVRSKYSRTDLRDWKDVIRQLADAGSELLFDADDAIKKIDNEIDLAHTAYQHRNIFKAYKASRSESSSTNIVKFGGTVHSELTLALILYSLERLNSEGLEQIIEVCDLISVECLCLIVCIGIGPQVDCGIETLLSCLLGCLNIARRQEKIPCTW